MISRYHPDKIPAKTLLKNWTRKLIMGLPDRFIKPLYSGNFIFVIGCGHSGTSLISAKLGNMPEVFLVGKESNAFSPFIGLEGSKAIVKEWMFFANGLQKSIIIEKTPKHVHSINRILRICPNAQFVGMVRNPLDNAASLYDRYGDLDFAIHRWKQDNEALLKNKMKATIHILSYEELTTSPVKSVSRLCGNLGIQFDEDCLWKEGNTYSAFEQPKSISNFGGMEMRAKQVNAPIVPKIGTWKNILSEQQKTFVISKTKNVHEALSNYCPLPLPN